MLLRRTVWDLPWQPGFVALDTGQKAFAIRSLAADDEQFQNLKRKVQEFVVAQLLVPVPLNRRTRFQRALRIFGRRLLWVGESWSERQRREKTEAAREFARLVAERNSERSQAVKTAGVDPRANLKSDGIAKRNEEGGIHGRRKAEASPSADDPASELLDPINADGGTVN